MLVLAKITAILDAFTLEHPSLTAADIRRATGIPASTAHRLLGNLVEHGFLDRSGDDYSIGARMAFWAGPAVRASALGDLLPPQLVALRDATGETSCFFIAERGSRVCVGVAETLHGLKREMYVGRIQPLHVGGAGRVLLAWRDDLLEAVLSSPLPALTGSTITDPEELRAVVAATRADGYAITTGERVEASSGVSAPVFDAHGALAGALTLMGPTLRLTPERCEELIDDVVAAADRLTTSIGGRRPQGLAGASGVG
nr:IclR family transcriptional regulator [Agrococcus sp. ARC_14]